ncbi:hypothetical protein EH165_03980 [Nakamurella antarctica]|uniref:Solute-binding protein family 5 domain-containing protein n=1 Tax=Nakamurella antarctica TaxID=1902245 RepID=A0A3G8ZSF2_9ACTN|nr:ABC transporter substrate-binding protein [Nakamurella antarctica]AZI57444.1 hypothetical protein EH165_03980 [Nakamurella antarctica]
MNITRRRSLEEGRGRRVLLFLMLSVLVSGCTPPGLPAALPPLVSDTAPRAPVVDDLISIGTDSVISGFNPYVAQQFSPAARAIAGLVLPTVFTPGNDGPGAAPTALVDRVAVTSLDPFTVTYSLNRGAAWSDGTPIAAEDFSYLWQQMIDPELAGSVVSPGGYQLISAITSADAGKTVIVQFAKPYAQWRTLFSPLLPARSVKDNPGGFLAALTGGFAVAGGPYKMTSYDAVVGEIKLARNDKYWAKPPGPSAVVLRTGSSEDLLNAFTRGDVNALYLSPDAVTASTLEQAAANTVGGPGAVRLQPIPQPSLTSLRFNTSPGRLTANPAIRRGVAAALDEESLQSSISLGWAAGSTAPVSQLQLPADPVHVATSAGNTGSVASELGDAGYQRSGLYYRQDAAVLSITLGYPVDDIHLTAAAVRIQSQLAENGIVANLLPLAPVDLAAALAVEAPADALLQTVPRSASDAAEAVSQLGCGAALNPSVIALPSLSASSLPPSSTRPSASSSTAAPTPTATPIRTPIGTAPPTTVAGPLGNGGEDPCPDPLPFQLTALLGGDQPIVVQPEVGLPEAAQSGESPVAATTTGTPAAGGSSTARAAENPPMSSPLPTVGTVSTYARPGTSAITAAQAFTLIDDELWQRMDSIPLAQPVLLLALGPALAKFQVEPADASEQLWGGPLLDLPQWPTSK